MDLIVNVELLYVLQCVQGKIFNYVEEFLISFNSILLGEPNEMSS